MNQEVDELLTPGTVVRTTEPNLTQRRQWTKQGWEERQWKVEGSVLRHSTAHGVCYAVEHPDGTVGYYDPSELDVVDKAHA